jgi:hypothetical protein
MLPDLEKKETDIKGLAKKALKDKKILAGLLEGIQSKKETIRYNSFKVLMRLSEEHPKVLYPEWDFFVAMLDSPNSYWRLSAVRLLANLTRADKENKFEKIFDQYYSLLNDSVIVAIYLVGDSGKIVRAKPKLQTKITDKLLSIDKTQQKHKDLIKGSALLALSQYFEKIKNKKKIIDFAKSLLKGESPKTRKIAQEFLSKWDKKG